MMTPTRAAKKVVLFIHGFGSSPDCWTKMLHLLCDDERIESQYDLEAWKYPTKWVEFDRGARIPTLAEIGQALADKIDSPAYHGRPVTLVGHSQGGLVILSYFHHLLTNNRATELENVRQAIFLATPCGGSTKASLLRRIASKFIKNPQEVALRVHDADVAAMMSEIREKVVGATSDSNEMWRVPIHAFAGMQDDIVVEASARGVFDNVKHVPGTHFTIVEPESRDDPRYEEIIELLLDPGGHSHRFDIEHYETRLTVEPRERQIIETRSYRNPRKVEFDNYARLKRTVRFARTNRCGSPFTIQYGTQGNGYVVGHTSVRNEVDSLSMGEWEDHGLRYRFDFKARPGEEFWLDVEIYDGFPEVRREIHFHLDDNSYRRKMTYILDLSAYIRHGYVVSQQPCLYMDPKHLEHNELCGQRDPIRLRALTSQTAEGVFTWELEEVRAGIVDIAWNVRQAAP